MLGWADWRLNFFASNVDESVFNNELPENHVQRLALEKSRKLKNISNEEWVIAADTIVVLDHEILGKPINETHAIEMLAKLRDRSHWVMTAIALRRGDQPEPHLDICRTEVKIRAYSESEISRYIQSGDPMDKAGAYAIQNRDFHPVVDFSGCMASVMGMPLCHLERGLRKYPGYENTDWPAICQINLKYECPISDRVLAGEVIG
jgi:MAF protein